MRAHASGLTHGVTSQSQWKFVHPLKQPWSGQSKTGSMQIFAVHELGPPSSLELPELLPESGRVNGGSWKPLLLALPAPPLLLLLLLLLEGGGADVSSCVVASSDGLPPSSPVTVASSPLEHAPQPLLLPPLLLL
jgi:hypothetical protein